MEALKEVCSKIRNEIEHLKNGMNALHVLASETTTGDLGEMHANITLAFRHLEDARMRLGKVIQASGDGVSKYDKPTGFATTKTLLLGALISLVLLGTSALLGVSKNAEMKELAYWQDELIQVSHAWRTTYAHQDANDVQLAYQSVKVIKAVQAQANAIGLLRQQIVLLSKNGDELTKQLEAHIDQPATIDGDCTDGEEDTENRPARPDEG